MFGHIGISRRILSRPLVILIEESGGDGFGGNRSVVNFRAHFESWVRVRGYLLIFIFFFSFLLLVMLFLLLLLSLILVVISTTNLTHFSLYSFPFLSLYVSILLFFISLTYFKPPFTRDKKIE